MGAFYSFCITRSIEKVISFGNIQMFISFNGEEK